MDGARKRGSAHADAALDFARATVREPARRRQHGRCRASAARTLRGERVRSIRWTAFRAAVGCGPLLPLGDVRTHTARARSLSYLVTSHPLDFIVLSPPGTPDVRLPAAAARAGALGVLDLRFAPDEAAATQALIDLDRHGRGRIGVLLDAPDARLRALLDAAGRVPDAVLLAADDGADLASAVALVRGRGARCLVVATDLGQAEAAAAAGADAVIAKGSEAGGWVGEESTFVLLQRLRARIDVPVWVHGGVGLHTASACLVGGAEGAVLDAQLLLTRESPLGAAARARIAALDGSETTRLGAALGAGVRVYRRPGLEPVAALEAAELELAAAGSGARDRWIDRVRAAVDWRDLDRDVLAIGQDACFAADLAERHRTVAGVLDALRRAAVDQARRAGELD